MAQTLGLNIMAMLTRYVVKKIEVLENNHQYFKLRIPRENNTIGSIFGVMSNNKRKLGIEFYSINQTTLEQIFQNLSSQSKASDKSAITFTFDRDSLKLMDSDQGTSENIGVIEEEKVQSLLLQDF